MTEPSQYFKGRTVQEQMNEVIGYVDTRAAEVATTAIAADVAQVHQDMLDADADAQAAAASAAAAAGTLANAVKKTGEASQSIAGDIAVSGTLSGGVVTGNVVTAPTPVNNTDAATKKYVDDADALKISITDINNYAVGLTGNQDFAGIKNNTTVGKGSVSIGGSVERWVRVAYSTENEIAFAGIVLPDKHSGSSRSMEFYCICYTSNIVFRYRQIFTSAPVTTNFAVTYDGTNYALWYHYSVTGTNERCAFHFYGTNFRNFVFDGVTSVASLDPADFTLYVNPTAVS